MRLFTMSTINLLYHCLYIYIYKPIISFAKWISNLDGKREYHKLFLIWGADCIILKFRIHTANNMMKR